MNKDQENINEAIINAAKEQEYPLPDGEVVLIQDNVIVNQFFINE